MFANFYTSQEANEWRSVTFESAYGAIMSQHGSTGATSATAQLSNTNVGEVKSRIIGIFQSLSQCSKPPFALPSEENISTVATLARQIAYQFGVNTNQLRLLMPQHGDKVQIGAAYHDYHNGDVDASISVTVDQVFSPGLQKLPTGHGGGDSSAMTLVPCQICDLAETSRSRKP